LARDKKRERKKEATLVVVRSTGLMFGERERGERDKADDQRVCAIQIRNWS
jgi:hypothetical protein